MTKRERRRRQDMRDRDTARRIANDILSPAIAALQAAGLYKALVDRADQFVAHAIGIGRASEAAKRLRRERQ